MNKAIHKQLKARRDAALRLQPLDHHPGDVRDPIAISPQPYRYSIQELRYLWRYPENRVLILEAVNNGGVMTL